MQSIALIIQKLNKYQDRVYAQHCPDYSEIEPNTKTGYMQSIAQIIQKSNQTLDREGYMQIIAQIIQKLNKNPRQGTLFPR